MSQKQDTLFRVIFLQNDHVCELYARSLTQESMFGFLEIEELVFKEEGTLVINPEEEKLKNEFKNVICTYIPMHTVLRVDELNLESTELEYSTYPKVQKENGKVRIFPSHLYNKKPEI